MPAIPGTILADKVSPGDTNTTFPTHEDLFGKGGLMSFSNLTNVTTASQPERLPLDRQKKGMLVYDQNTQKYYSLYDTSTNADLKTTVNPIFEVKGVGDQVKLYNIEIVSLTAANIVWDSTGIGGVNNQTTKFNTLITAVKGLSSGEDIELFNNKKLKLGYSPIGAGVNDGAEFGMDFSLGGDIGELVIATRDNGNEAIVFKQTKSDAAPAWEMNPIVIGTDHNVGVACASGTRTFSAELTVQGNISASKTLSADKIFANSINGYIDIGTTVVNNNTTIQLLGSSSPSIIGIRLSLDSATATPTTDITSASSVYIHPFKGSVITLYNTVEAKWEILEIPGIIEIPLVGTVADTNYDIYMYKTGTTTFSADFVAWSNQGAGTSVPPTRGYQDGTAVRNGQPNKRLVGCLRTIGNANRTCQTFGGNVAGGANCRQYLWNAQNIIPVTCYSFEPAIRYQYTIPVAQATGYNRVNPSQYSTNGGSSWIATPNAGRNNRFSFIVGEPTLVNMISQVYANATTNFGSIVTYTALGLNREDTASTGEGSQMVSELQGSNMTPRAQVLKTFNAGFHYIQAFENILGPAGTVVVMNEEHVNQTGYLASIYN
jgi:hypothetical protein